MGIKLSAEQIQYMAVFESISGASILDCVLPEKSNRVVYVVRRGDMSMAIGKGGYNVRKARERLGKDIEVVEYNEDPKEFITKLVSPARVQGIRIVEDSDRKMAYISVHPRDRGIAIGRDGATIQKVKILSRRHHQIDNVVVV